MSYKPASFDRLELKIYTSSNGYYVSDSRKLFCLYDDNAVHVGRGTDSWNCYCKTLNEAQVRLTKYNNTRV